MVPAVAGAVMLLFVVVFFVAAGRQSARDASARDDLLRAFAAARGFEVLEADREGLAERVARLPAVGTARDPVAVYARRRLRDGTCWVFHRGKVSRQGGGGGFYTVCLIESDRPYRFQGGLGETEGALAARLGRRFAGRVRGASPVPLDDPAFDDRFVVLAAAPTTVREDFPEGARAALLSSRGALVPPRSVGVDGRLLGVHDSGQSSRSVRTVEEVEALFETATRLHEALPRA